MGSKLTRDLWWLILGLNLSGQQVLQTVVKPYCECVCESVSGQYWHLNCRQMKTEHPLHCGWASSHPVRVWMNRLSVGEFTFSAWLSPTWDIGLLLTWDSDLDRNFTLGILVFHSQTQTWTGTVSSALLSQQQTSGHFSLPNLVSQFLSWAHTCCWPGFSCSGELYYTCLTFNHGLSLYDYLWGHAQLDYMSLECRVNSTSYDYHYYNLIITKLPTTTTITPKLCFTL